MPSVSEPQRKLFALVNSVQKGKARGAITGKVRRIADSMSQEQTHDFMRVGGFKDRAGG